MNATLERLVVLKSAATTTSAQIDYLDTLLTDTVRLCQRPGDVERTAAHLDELLAEVAAARASVRPVEAPPSHERPHGGTDTHRATYEPPTGTGSHRALNPQETP